MPKTRAKVFQHMRRLQLGDVVAFNQAMTALDRGHRWEEARRSRRAIEM